MFVLSLCLIVSLFQIVEAVADAVPDSISTQLPIPEEEGQTLSTSTTPTST